MSEQGNLDKPDMAKRTTPTASSVVDELKAIRDVYDRMEEHQDRKLLRAETEAEYDLHVGWRAWKMIRNVITDRIEELTGKRQ